jgi:hypothetical protein
MLPRNRPILYTAKPTAYTRKTDRIHPQNRPHTPAELISMSFSNRVCDSLCHSIWAGKKLCHYEPVDMSFCSNTSCLASISLSRSGSECKPKAVFRDILTLTNDRPGGVFQLGEGTKNRGADAIHAYLRCD